MKKKVLKGKKGDDPDWVQDIACYFFTYRKNWKSDEYEKELNDLFLEYKEEGMGSREAWEKAKKVFDCFEIE
jgi:hypothetical protein